MTDPAKGMDLNREAGLKVLADLKHHGVPFIVMGSFALEMILKKRLPEPPRDLDLFLPNDLGAIEGFAQVTEGLGFSSTVWQDPLERPVSKEQLEGRFYVRAKRFSDEETLIIDATYECRHLTFEKAWKRRLQGRNYPLICLKHQCLLMEARGSKKDKTLLQILKNTAEFHEENGQA